jgi:primary-amine oxidase
MVQFHSMHFIVIPLYLSWTTGVFARTISHDLSSNSHLLPREASCSQNPQRTTIAPKRNIWAGLSATERTELKDWLNKWLNPNTTQPILRRALHDLPHSNNSMWNSSNVVKLNTAGALDSLNPNKSDALLYLEGKGPAPPKYAQFVAYYGSVEKPYFEKLSIGPLPLSNKTTVQSMGYLSTEGDDGKRLAPSPTQADKVGRTLDAIQSRMKDIIEDLIGPVSASCF